MDAIAGKIERKSNAKAKIMKAFDYKYVNQEEIDDYNKSLVKQGKQLQLVELSKYDQLPPDDVLKELKIAKEKECFDSFVVAHIVAVKDPILFGKIKDFPTLYFFIGQWGDDVKIEDILKYE